MHTDTRYFHIVTPVAPEPGARARLPAWLRRFAVLSLASIAAFVALATGTLMTLTLIGLTPFALGAAWFARRRLARDATDADRAEAVFA